MDTPHEKKLTNPAKRLHAILNGTGDQSVVNKAFREYLAGRLGGDAKNDLEMLRKVLGLYDLVSLTDRRIGLMKHLKRQTFAACIKPIVTTLQQTSLDTQASQIANQLRVGPLPILDLASDALDVEQPEFLIEQSELDGLYTDADGLAAKIEASDVPPDLRAILTESIERIKKAIKDYPLGGAEGLDRVIKESYGTVIVESAVVLPQKDNPTVRAYWDWLARINATVAASKNAYALGLLAADVIVRLLDHIAR